MLLSHVLSRVGLTHDEFIAAYQDEVVVYEVSQKVLDAQNGHTSSDKDRSSTSAKQIAEGHHVDLVRMCDVVRRLLSIDVISVSIQHR